MTASQLIEEEVLARKNAAAASSALSMAEYIYNYPGMPEGAQIVLHQLKLDLVASSNFSWREAHNKMLLRCFIALANLKETQPPIDEEHKLALFHAPFTGTTLFGGELAKLQEANTKRANAVTVFPPTAPLSPIPDRMSVKGEISTIQTVEEAIIGGAVAGAEDRAGPHQMPLILTIAILKKVQLPWQCHSLQTLRSRNQATKTPEKISVIFEEEDKVIMRMCSLHNQSQSEED